MDQSEPVPKLRLSAAESAEEITRRCAREQRAANLQRESDLEDSLAIRPARCHRDLQFFIPEGWLKIAQRFSVGSGPNERTSPGGTAEHAGYFSRPSGTYLLLMRGPNAEALGYSRMSLRDGDMHLREPLKSDSHWARRPRYPVPVPRVSSFS